ncbi:MAG: hypothetical protein ACE37D_20420 [Pseudomonadales bacterium]
MIDLRDRLTTGAVRAKSDFSTEHGVSSVSQELVENSYTSEWTFSSLNLVRKLYVYLLAFATILVLGGVSSAAAFSDVENFVLVFALIFSIASVWNIFAIIRRRVGQLYFIALLNLLSLNLIGLLIQLSLIRVSRHEVNPSATKEQESGSSVRGAVWGLILFVSAIFLVAWSTQFAGSNFPYQLGRLLGGTLVLSLLVFSGFAITKISVPRNLVAGLVSFGFACYQTLTLYQKGVENKENIEVLGQALDSFNDDSPLPVAKGLEYETSVVFASFFSTIRRSQLEYQGYVEEAQLEEALTPKTLVDIASARDYINRIEALKQRANLLLLDQVDLLRSTEAELSTVNKASAAGFGSKLEEATQQIKDSFEYETRIYDVSLEILDLCLRARMKGLVHEDNGYLYFQSTDQQNEYNRLIDELNRLIDEQESYEHNRMERLNKFRKDLDETL